MDTGVGACYCGMCRRWGGGPLLAVDCGTSVRLTGEEHVGVFASSKWAERGFCKQCGSHLFYRLKQNGQYICQWACSTSMRSWSSITRCP